MLRLHRSLSGAGRSRHRSSMFVSEAAILKQPPALAPMAEVRLNVRSEVGGEESAKHTNGHNGSNASNGMAMLAAEGIVITCKNLSYTIVIKPNRQQRKAGVKHPYDKKILDGVTGFFRPRELTALMGPSGAGKTTLLDVIAGRKNVGQETGELLFGGARRPKLFKKMAAYVEQQDTLAPNLTVYEMLLYSALLKMTQSTPLAVKKDRVEKIIAALGLRSVRDTKIGSNLIRGISGGQKKRVNIGVELMFNPSMLFLDEPTSGLDSATSHDIIRVVRGLADGGRTVICTIHQPSSDIYSLFDELLLLCQGQLVYLGKAQEAVPYFVSQGFYFHQGSNAAEYLIEVTGGGISEGVDYDFHRAYAESELRKHNDNTLEQLLLSAGATTAVGGADGGDKQQSTVALAGSKSKYETSFPFATWTLLRRRAASSYQDRQYFGTRIMSRLFVGALIATVWANQGFDQFGLNNLVALNYLIPTFFGMSATLYVPFILTERPLFLRERHDGMYRVSSFFMATVLVEYPALVVSTILFALIVYWSVGFISTFIRVIYFILVLAMESVCALSYAVMIGAVSPTPEVAGILAPLTLILFMIFSGFLILKPSIPHYWIWAHYISFFTFTFEGLVVNQFGGDQLNADYTSHCKPNQQCQIHSGRDVLHRYDLEGINKWHNIGWLAVLWAGYSLLAFLALKYIKHHKR
eukprot:jgi/Chlat1/7668/Chrsp64S07172